MIDKIVLASSNKGKIFEFSDLFKHYQIAIKAQGDYQVPDVDETGLSFIENAILKARNAAKFTNLPAIADDSGLCVPALDNAPGIYSARYAGTAKSDQANNDKLLANLEGKSERNAFFVCTIAFCQHAEDPLPLIATGIWQGQILRKPEGENGFGYDPLFYVPEFQKTAAQLPLAIKNQHSHRGIALANFMKDFQKRYASPVNQ